MTDKETALLGDKEVTLCKCGNKWTQGISVEAFGFFAWCDAWNDVRNNELSSSREI